MSECALLVRVTLHAPLYHGQPEWPPSPARLFQAVVAGAGHHVDEADVAQALRWWEAQRAPIIAVPDHVEGRLVTTYVPNNDLDAEGGDPSRLPAIRTAKTVRARHLAHPQLVFVWEVEACPEAERVVALLHGVYQLGRGVDMAFARGELMSLEAAAAALADHAGEVHRPSPGVSTGGVSCPRIGTFDSLVRRYAAQSERFAEVRVGRKSSQVFAQPPKALFRQVAYDARAQRLVFELRSATDPGRFAPVDAARVVETLISWRDAGVARLLEGGLSAPEVHAALVGRRPGEEERIPSRFRTHLSLWPSVGHEHADGRLRRLVVEVPAGGPLSFRDVRWAFSGLIVGERVLLLAEDEKVADRYLGKARRWCTATAACLPAPRRRIDPARVQQEAKGAPERLDEEAAARDAVRQALRHAHVLAKPVRIEVQREPFFAHGQRAEAFEVVPRFPKERCWHVRITFDREVAGPLVVGDGRFVGLGLMQVDAPKAEVVTAFRIGAGLTGTVDPGALARHLRRAVLARTQQVWGRQELPPWITGHTADGSPAEGHGHLRHLVDPVRQRLLIVTPRSDRRLASALAGLTELRAGPMGVLTLEPVPVAEDDPLLAPSCRWASVTPYRLQRHRKAGSAHEAATLDVLAACQGLPPVQVQVGEVRSVRGGVEVHGVVLTFSRPVAGPLALGKTSHLGGGLFEAIR